MAQPGSQTGGVLPPEQMGYIPDKLKKAEKRIEASPYDTEAWSVLIRDAQMKKIEDARLVYERLVAQFPNAGKYWRIYIEQELFLLEFIVDSPDKTKCVARDMKHILSLSYVML